MNNLKYRNNKRLFILVITCFNLIYFTACDNQEQQKENNSTLVTTEAPIQKQNNDDNNIIIENKSYLFDIKGHSLSELEALLERTEEVTMTQPSEYQDIEIVMIIHGPDIEWFTQQNHADNQKLLDLAARLDADDIIDMKVCETSMEFHGIERKDIPEFIDSVPYAPVEIKTRLRDGYINL